MSIPLLGKIDFGFLYALIIIPVAIVGASNGFNMIAGYNGLEAGLGMLILSTLAYIAYSSGSAWVAIIAACMVLSLLAFYFFNRYPAKVFPGDTMTYTVGAMIAAIAIFANIEKFAAILFTPYFIELLLKLRGRFQKESFAKLSGDGSLILPYTKLYGLEHVAILVLSKIKKRVTENNVVFSLYAFQMLFIIIALVV
jgi:UDP-N-acetylglucosamine--dolichyl-phosphate N-acetylglucosaminephosphotransferase